MQYSDLSASDKELYLRDEFIRLIENVLVDKTSINSFVAEKERAPILNQIDALKCTDCTCNMCIEIGMLDEASIMFILDPLWQQAKQLCTARNY